MTSISEFANRCAGFIMVTPSEAGFHPMRVMRGLLGRAVVLATVLVSAVATSPAPAAAQSTADGRGLSGEALDSVRAGLMATDWNERHAALARINEAYDGILPPGVAEPVLDLLVREAADEADHAGDEDFGEYLVDLVLTGVRTDNVRAVPSILQLDGLGMSSGIASFVARQGRNVMPALDAFARTRDDRASDVLETYALMYARHGARLSRGDSVQVLRRLVAAASDPVINVRSHLAFVAASGPIAELLPAVDVLARTDSETLEGVYSVRRAGTAALPALQRARAAMPTGEILNRLTLLTDAACDPADARLAAPCTALRASLADAGRLVAAGQRGPAVKALDVYVRDVQRLGVGGLLPRLTVVALDGNGRAVIARLVA